MKKIYTIFFLLSCLLSSAQVRKDTLAFQNFELGEYKNRWNYVDTLSYKQGFSSPTAKPANSPLGIGGSRAWEVTSFSPGKVMQPVGISIPSGYDSVILEFKLAAMDLISPDGGPDRPDYVKIEISTDSGKTFYSRVKILGARNSNGVWSYNAKGVAQAYYLPRIESTFSDSSQFLDTAGFSTCRIIFPGSIKRIDTRLTARSSSTTDTWLIDNLLLTGLKTITSLSDSKQLEENSIIYNSITKSLDLISLHTIQKAVVYNLSGQIIVSKENILSNITKLPIPETSYGYHVVRVNTDTGSFFKRFVVTN